MASFKKVEFPIGGMFVFREGEPVNKAYLIKEGELMMISKRVPTNVSVMISSDYQAIQAARARKHQIKNNSGFFSETANSMQISVASENQFAGDELLLLKDNKLPYSYVTKGKVIAY